MKNYIVVGLNFGDEGKGSIVHFLSSPDHVVVRFNGGCQAAHNVVYQGKHHTFSQFGAGTLKGASTYLDQAVIVDPISMWYEYRHLIELGCDPEITVNPDCLVTTPYHRLANRIIDKRNGHGSTGLGIGLTREMWSQTGDGLLWSDLGDLRVLKRKMHWIRQWCQDKVADYPNTSTNTRGNFHEYVDDLYTKYEALRKRGVVFNSEYFHEDRSRPVIFEGAQGLHLDEVYGTIPHTTYSDTTPERARELCNYWGLEVETLGVTRTYETRHGNGPMHQEWSRQDSPLVSELLESDHNHNNGSFAGHFRVGGLNTEWLRHAADIADIDALVINHVDQMPIPEFEIGSPTIITGHGPEDKRWVK